jgi:hypothetical protein
VLTGERFQFQGGLIAMHGENRDFLFPLFPLPPTPCSLWQQSSPARQPGAGELGSVTGFQNQRVEVRR